MRRAAPCLLATAIALVLLANFHTTPGQTVATTPAPTVPVAPTTVGHPPAAGPPGRAGSGLPPTTAFPATTTTSAVGGGAKRVVDGPTEENRYGPVQVRVTLSGNQIVDVEALQLPSDRARSEEISHFAEPALREEALQAQSAQIHTVSGATYTSTSYRQSLQAALVDAGHH